MRPKWHGIRKYLLQSNLQGIRVDSDTKNIRTCGMCNEQEAVSECEGCLRPLCKKCRTIEIWRSPGEEVIIRYFCLLCRDDAAAGPQLKGERVFGLGQVTDMVNQEQGKVNRFKIKLKI